MRRFAMAAVISIAIGAPVPAALGASGPAPFVTRGKPVQAPGAGATYTARTERGATTVKTIVTRTDRRGEKTRGTIPGDWAIPAVASDRSSTGLSADGGTLVLDRIGPVDYQRTQLAVLSTHPLALRQVVDLPGAFSIDAVAPNGSRIYLVQYLSRSDITRYAVRAYDLRAGRLDPNPIVDPREHEGQMRGQAITRVMSPDWRWAYTLYGGGENGAFIHALDTAQGRARCIDLPHFLARSVFNDSLRVGATGRIDVVGKFVRPVASVNPRTFAVQPHRAGLHPMVTKPALNRRPSPGSNDGGGTSWLLLALGAGLILAAASFWGMPKLHRRRLAGSDD